MFLCYVIFPLDVQISSFFGTLAHVGSAASMWVVYRSIFYNSKGMSKSFHTCLRLRYSHVNLFVNLECTLFPGFYATMGVLAVVNAAAFATSCMVIHGVRKVKVKSRHGAFTV